VHAVSPPARSTQQILIVNPFLRLPYAGLVALADAAAAVSPRATQDAPKWRRALSARRHVAQRIREFEASREPWHERLWFHAPSVGESLQALPVAQRIRERRPDIRFAVTHFSPSAEEVVSRFDAEFADYLPFDSRRAAALLARALRPSALVYAKLDVWPVLTHELSRQGIPVALISATLSRRSSRRGLARAVLRDAYRALDRIGAVDSEDAERLVRLGARSAIITVTGDTRYDQVWERVRRLDQHWEAIRAQRSARPTLVAGSTWPADEEKLLPAWEAVRRSVRDARLIIAPHEPGQDHVRALTAWATQAQLRVTRVSAFMPTTEHSGSDRHAAVHSGLWFDMPAEFDVIVVDRVGLLAEIYALGTAAFVGGGFHAAGLHSVLEPAAVGVPVSFGPRWVGSRDAAALLKAGSAASADTQDTLARSIAAWLQDPALAAEEGAEARRIVERGLGAAEASAQLVLDLLGKTATSPLQQRGAAGG
jgi:3-deoxy-D-manno-octulosonic-acid transferase